MRVALPKRNTLVCVHWRDAYASASWQASGTRPQCADCYSVGWLVSKTRRAIQLSQTVSRTPGCERAGLLSIPRGCLVAVDAL